MAKVHGKGGDVRIDANQVAEVESWTGNLVPDLVQTTALQDSFHEQTPGPVGMTGSVAVFWDAADTNGQVAMQTAVITPATVNLRLYESASNYYHFTAYLEVASNVSITDVVKRTYNFTSHGTIAYV